MRHAGSISSHHAPINLTLRSPRELGLRCCSPAVLTGYAIARSAGLARANAYSALRVWSRKGAARVDSGRPKRYRPRPAALIAGISTDHGLALDRLSSDLEAVTVPATPTLVEMGRRAILQPITHDVACHCFRGSPGSGPTPTPACPRACRPYSAGLPLVLCATVWWTRLRRGGGDPGELGWPGMPIISIVDDRSAIRAARTQRRTRALSTAAPPSRALAGTRTLSNIMTNQSTTRSSTCSASTCRVPRPTEELRADISAFRALRPERHIVQELLPSLGQHRRVVRLPNLASLRWAGMTTSRHWRGPRPMPPSIGRRAVPPGPGRVGKGPRVAGGRRATVILPRRRHGATDAAPQPKGTRCARAIASKTRPRCRPVSGPICS